MGKALGCVKLPTNSGQPHPLPTTNKHYTLGAIINRRMSEKAEIARLENDYCTPDCALDAKWADKWRKFINNETNKIPNEIDNNHIHSGDYIVKDGLIRNTDYLLISTKLWTFLLDTYGGGPKVMPKPNTLKIKYYINYSDNILKTIKVKITKTDTINDIKRRFCRKTKAVDQYIQLNVKQNHKYIKLKSNRILRTHSTIYASLLPSSSNCLFAKRAQLILQDFPVNVKKYLTAKGSKCFCKKCCSKRGDCKYYTAGNPNKRYVIPRGWYRFGINKDLINNNHKDEMDYIFQNWHRSYHGTTYENCVKIFRSGLVLKRPGSVAQFSTEDIKIQCHDHHIQEEFERYNYYTKEYELFNPRQLFTSPSIKYSSNEIYAETHSYKSKSLQFYGRYANIKIKTVFQCLQKPHSYTVGQETIDATNKKIKIDKYIQNNQLEWYTLTDDIVLYGFLIRFEINGDSDSDWDNDYSDTWSGSY